MTTEPWNVSFAERYQKLTHTQAKHRLIYIYERADTSTFRYRVYNTCQALQYSSNWVGSYFFENELDHLDKLIPTLDLVIFSRVRWSYPMDTFFHKVKKERILTAFDVDDLVFDKEKIPLLLETLGVSLTEENYTYWFSYISRLWMMGNICDFTIGSNQFLCERLKTVFNKHSYEISNFLNHEQLAVSEEIFKTKSYDRDSFKIGYFSGTPSHNKDFRLIAPDVARFLDKYRDATLEVVGFIDFPESLLPHVSRKQIFHSPLVDFLSLQKKIAHVDLNIVPLVENEFTNCKSELKFFEAAIVGTLTCATPTYTFVNNIQHAKTGFLCQQDQWYETIENIYHNNIPASIRKDAQEYCLNKYSPKVQCQVLEKTFDDLVKV